MMAPNYHEQENIGRCRYVVSYHDGAKTHADGSAFYDVAIFGNRRAKDRFVASLKRSGYVVTP